MTAFSEHLQDAFRRFGPVETRRMFGGAGVYHQGVMFGLVVDEVLYLKVDDASRAAFVERGLGPFEYTRLGKRVKIGSFFQAPEEVLEDADAALAWARRAYEAALRAKTKKPARKPLKHAAVTKASVRRRRV